MAAPADQRSAGFPYGRLTIDVDREVVLGSKPTDHFGC